MPSNFQSVVTNLMIGAASASYTLDVDTYNFHNEPFVMLIESSYANTGVISGIQVTIYDGVGPGDNENASTGIPVVKGGSSLPSYTTKGITYVLTTPNFSSGAQTVSSSLEFLCVFMSRWARLVFTNVDPVNTATVNIVAQIP